MKKYINHSAWKIYTFLLTYIPAIYILVVPNYW